MFLHINISQTNFAHVILLSLIFIHCPVFQSEMSHFQPTLYCRPLNLAGAEEGMWKEAGAREALTEERVVRHRVTVSVETPPACP